MSHHNKTAALSFLLISYSSYRVTHSLTQPLLLSDGIVFKADIKRRFCVPVLCLRFALC